MKSMLSLTLRKGLEGQLGGVRKQDGLHDDKASNFLLWGGTKVKDVLG